MSMAPVLTGQNRRPPLSIAQIGFPVGRTDEQALPRLGDFQAAVAWPRFFDLAGNKTFQQRGFSAAHGVHFADFDQPLAAQMLAYVLATADVRQGVGKPLTAECGTGRRLHCALWAFQHHHVIGLAAGFVDTRHHGDQEHAADSGGVRVVFDAELCG